MLCQTCGQPVAPTMAACPACGASVGRSPELAADIGPRAALGPERAMPGAETSPFAPRTGTAPPGPSPDAGHAAWGRDPALSAPLAPPGGPTPRGDWESLDSGAALGADDPGVSPTREPADGSMLRGVVTGLTPQTVPRETGGLVGATDTLWTFRLAGASPGTPLVSIELLGHTIWGVLNDGDEVAVSVAASSRGLRRAEYVRNLTTGAVVQPGSDSRGVRGRLKEQAIARGVRLPDIHGVVAGFAHRSEALGHDPEEPRPETDGKLTTVAVWTFRVHAAVPSGGLVVVPVEMRELGYIPGALRDGDAVAIASPWQQGLTLRPFSLENRSTGERITTHDLGRELSRIPKRERALALLVLVWFVGWFAALSNDIVPLYAILSVVLLVLGTVLRDGLKDRAARRYRRDDR